MNYKIQLPSDIASEECLQSPRSSLYVVNVCQLLQQCQLREFWTVTQSQAFYLRSTECREQLPFEVGQP